jgi:hypothetical protein
MYRGPFLAGLRLVWLAEGSPAWLAARLVACDVTTGRALVFDEL